MKYYLAIDIGASSGRHILGYFSDGVLKLEEVYRFENNLIEDNGSLIWDIDHLVSEVKNGIQQCSVIGKIPESVAIDTWGVDYVLLDEKNEVLKPVYCYRDSRTEKTVPLVESVLSFDELYSRTGIQKQNFNTIYQLYADKVSGKLDKAESFMMIPDYLGYCLTGVVKNEYTNATTGALVNANTKAWDFEIIDKLGYPRRLFKDLSTPCQFVGEFSSEMQAFAGFNSKVIHAPSHDTASAVAGCPLLANSLYISSGTWSLMGAESTTAVLSDTARKCNFSNEGGIDYRFRVLKNYMGMWLLQNIRRNLNKKYTYDEMMYMAMDCKNVRYIDVNAPEFVAPKNMIEAIRSHLSAPDMPIDEVICAVYHSLAKSYKSATEEIEGLTGQNIENIFIVGGGSADTYLNSLTAQYTGKKVFAGPKEATATGNLISQMMADDQSLVLDDARKIVGNSFNIKEAK